MYVYTSKAADTPSHDRHRCRLRRRTFVVDVYAVHSGRHSQHRCCAPRHTWSLRYLATPTLTVPVSVMDMNGKAGRDALSKAERTAVAAAVNAILFRCQLQRREGRMRAAIRARRKRTLQSMNVDVEDTGAICEAVLQVCYAMGCGAFPRATPRWWMKRRTRGTWEDLRQGDDATADYFKDKLRMSPRVFREIAEALSPFLQRCVTFYREPLQPDHIVEYALCRWVSGKTYESGTSSLSIVISFGLCAVRDVTAALLSASGKLSWPMGLQKAVVFRALLTRVSPTAMGASTAPTSSSTSQRIAPGRTTTIETPFLHPGVGRRRCELARARSVRWISWKLPRREDHPPVEFMDARGGRGAFQWATCHAAFRCADERVSAGRQRLSPSGWVVVPYGGLSQHPSELRFDNKQKTARGEVERAFYRLKGMWRLFLHSHKTNMEMLPQQFVAVCILHNILIDEGIPFDDNLLWEVGPNDVCHKVDLGMQRSLRPLCMKSSTGDALILRDALAERMGAQ
ncbi:hypothetical protein CBR_g22289 [Chara braunii]|uniref:DDE Tnp4 domain-containing protein n=1 Tax=Chara braunii TaxID=69332 RepID=A0A388L2L6_CHABU|nr:hypothetical protein CBR_g22289 [Chara braunii]|eukprot:GBG76541.1 hypothetical protein CBR_g22289 [Chara braunii]